ncbi:unnamed protein product, partial [Ixodes hexagonus]
DASGTEDGPSCAGSSSSWASQVRSSSNSLDTRGTEVRVKQEVASDDSADEEGGTVDDAMFKMEFSVEEEDGTSDPRSMTSGFAGVRVKQEPVSNDDTYGCSTSQQPSQASSQSSFHCVTPGGVEVHIKQEPVSDEETGDPSAMEHLQAGPVEASFLQNDRVSGLGDVQVRVKQECVTDEETGNSYSAQVSQGTDGEFLIVPDPIASALCSRTTKIKEETGGQQLIVQDPTMGTGATAVPVNANQSNTVRTFIVPNMASLGQVMRIISSSGANDASNQIAQFLMNQQATNVTSGNLQAVQSQTGSSAASTAGRQTSVASYYDGSQMGMRIVNRNSTVVQQTQASAQRTATAAQQARFAEKKAPVKIPSILERPVPSSKVKIEKVDKGVQVSMKPPSRTVSVQTSTCVRSMSVQTEEPALHITTQTSTTSHCTLAIKREPSPIGPSSSKQSVPSSGAAKEAKGPKKYVVSGSSLLQLLDKCQNCLLPVVPEVKVNGTLVEMSAVCAEGHLTTWRNQPSKT